MANFKVNSIPSRIQYTATNAQTEFSVPYPFINDADLSVWQNGILLTLNIDYTLLGSDTASGGQMTLIVPASLNDIITIQDLMVVDRTNIYQPVISALTGSALNEDFNRDVIMIRDTQTTVNYLMLQYPGWVQISQDIEITTDRIIPLLPERNVWRKDPTNTFIQAFFIPDNPIGIAGVFTADNRLISTDLMTGDTYVKQTDLQLIGDTITAMSGPLVLRGTNNVTLDTPGSIYFTPGNYLFLDGTQWPTNSPMPYGTIRFKNGSTTQLEWAISPTITGSGVNNAIVVFDGTGGALKASNIEILSNEITTFSGDLTLGAFTNSMTVTNDPTVNLGIATKQYVDNHSGIPGGANGDLQYKNGSSFGGDSISTDGSGNWTGSINLAGTFNPTQLHVNSAYAMPTTDGTNGQVFKTDGVGNVTWGSGGAVFDYQNTYWVSMANGNDANDGLSIDTPFQTYQHALNQTETGDTIVYGVDAGLSFENIDTLLRGYRLTINAPGVLFYGNLINSGAIFTLIAHELGGTYTCSVGYATHFTITGDASNFTLSNFASMILTARSGSNYALSTGSTLIANTLSPISGITNDGSAFLNNVPGSTIPGIYGPIFITGGLRIGTSTSVGGYYNFPTTDGTSNQFLQTDGLGNLSWLNVPGYTPLAYTNVYWVDAQTGSDLNLGTSIETPFATLQHAINTSGAVECMIYYMNTWTDNTALTTLGLGAIVTIFAPAVTFGISFDVLTGDRLYITCEYLTALTNAGQTYVTANGGTVAANTGTLTGTIGDTIYTVGGLGFGASTGTAASFNFPTVDGSAGQVPTTNGAGVVSWATPATPTTLTWTSPTAATVTAAVGNGYVSSRATLQTFNVPATFSVGDIIVIEGYGAGGYIAQASGGVNFIMGTVAGAANGSVASTNDFNNCYMVGLVANTTYKVYLTNGALTLV